MLRDRVSLIVRGFIGCGVDTRLKLMRLKDSFPCQGLYPRRPTQGERLNIIPKLPQIVDYKKKWKSVLLTGLKVNNDQNLPEWGPVEHHSFAGFHGGPETRLFQNNYK